MAVGYRLRLNRTTGVSVGPIAAAKPALVLPAKLAEVAGRFSTKALRPSFASSVW